MRRNKQKKSRIQYKYTVSFILSLGFQTAKKITVCKWAGGNQEFMVRILLLLAKGHYICYITQEDLL
jgi:hypothetical protein